MTTPKGHAPVETAFDMFRDISRTLVGQERRPQVTNARDLLGPGFGATATELLDWNSASARFNGFWSSVDALNGPTATGRYLGLSIASADGQVTQVAIAHDSGVLVGNPIYVRRLHTRESQAAQYTTWELVNPVAEVPVGAVVFLPTASPLPAGWGESATTAPSGTRAIRRL
jgi:hypothetical protein